MEIAAVQKVQQLNSFTIEVSQELILI